jgi:hypothetical protein
LVIILVHEAIVVIIHMEGHSSYYPSIGAMFGCYPYGRPFWLLSLWEAILVIILVQEAIVVIIPMGGHLGYYPSTGGQTSYLC